MATNKKNEARRRNSNFTHGSIKNLGENISRLPNLKKNYNEVTWSPNIPTAFKAFALARLCSALWNNITDCDETYNYWEPMHYILYGSGFQTWEYSPVYGLRSYAYILMHSLLGWICGIILNFNRVIVFYSLRCFLGLVCTGLETYFYRGVVQEFGPAVGRLTFVFLLFSAGMFQSSTAFLPSSFSMYMCLLSMGAWFQKCYSLAIVSTAVSTFLSWPFAGVLGIGIAIDLLLLQNKWKMFFSWCIISVLTVLVPVTVIDSYFYGRLVVAPLNIVLYNIFSNHGPDLYGTSPWSFYFLNGFLNFNAIFPLALISLPSLFITWKLNLFRRKSVAVLLALLPLYTWIIIFFTQPHKEERFLYPIYPLICLAASFTWISADGALKTLKLPNKCSAWLTLVLIICSSAISLSRIVGQYKGFHAPLDVFLELNRFSRENGHSNEGLNVCIGKEWYRFPSSFFLPINWKLLYLQSEFRGQLPRSFDPPPNGTWTIPSHMNDLNLEETSRYASLNDCHFIVDLDTRQSTDLEPHFDQMKEWESAFHTSFLEASESPQLFRAFYIPWLSEKYISTISYTLYKRRTHGKEMK